MGTAKPPDDQNKQNQTTDTGTIETTETTGITQANGDTPDITPQITPDATLGRQPKVLTIPSNVMTKIKAEERERGRKQVLKDLDAQARSMGFKDHADMQQAALRAKGRNGKTNGAPATRPTSDDDDLVTETTTPPTNGKPVGHPRVLSKLEKQIAKLNDDRKALRRSVAHEEKRRKQLERELESREAEAALRIEAIRAGVKDVDYAIELLRRSMAGKTADQLRSFDEAKFFADELRRSHPYLYEVEQRPATTGNSGNQAPPLKAEKV